MTHRFIKLSAPILLAAAGFLFFTSQAFAIGWVVELESSTSAYYSIGASSDTDMIAVGSDGYAVYSNDGGKSWTEGTSGTTEFLFDLDVVNGSLAVASGNGVLLTSDDGGISWTSQTAPTTNQMFDVDMLSETEGLVVGRGGMVATTSDGAVTWTTFITTSTDDLYGLHYYAEDAAWVVGDNGSIMFSDDGGVSWNSQASGTTETLHDVHFLTESVGWIVGEGGAVLTTEDGGTTWTQSVISELSGEDLYKVSAISKDDVIIAGMEMMLRTSDRGSSWEEYDSEVQTVLGIHWSSGDDIWASGGLSSTSTDASISRLDAAGPSAVTEFAILGGSPTTNATPTFAWAEAVDGETAISNYFLQVDSFSSSDIGNVTEYTLAETSDGEHTVIVWAEDLADNDGDESTVTFTIDTVAPSVGVLSPIEALTNEETDFTITVTDVTSGGDYCDLYLNGSPVEIMADVGDGTFAGGYTFTVAGTYSAYAECFDAAGNSDVSSTISVTVGEGEESSSEEEEAVDEADIGSLLKLACDDGAEVNDPCKAVYYYSAGGERHAFPNDKVYFTWYDDFDDLVVVTDDFMASISLGSNVTYHPGTKMVTFQSTHDVYAVATGGVLRYVSSEEIAEELYGEEWNTHIDDISDAFFGNYSFGDDIDDASDYIVDDEVNSVDSIDDNL